MREMPTNRHLKDLAERPGPWVTICMPLSGGGPIAKGDPIRYRNLVRTIQDQLDARGMERARRDALLGPLSTLAADHDVFNAGARGLVVFVSPDTSERWHLPITIEETARVDERPYLEPLIPLVTDPVHFYIVVISLHDVRLLECSRFVVRELPLPEGTPKRLEDAAGWEVRQDSLQYHDPHSGPLLSGGHSRKHRTQSSVGNSPIFHGQGYGKDDSDVDIGKFVRDLDRGLWQAVTHKGSPVVLVASDQIEPIFREHTRLPNVVHTLLHGNYERAPAEELHARALEVLAPRFEEEVERAKERFGDLAGTGVATSQIEQVVIAAADGKIDTLFVREGAHLPGTYDAESHSVRVGNGRAAVTDLLDRAATDTFLTGGRVYRLGPERMPVAGEVAAILRY